MKSDSVPGQRACGVGVRNQKRRPETQICLGMVPATMPYAYDRQGYEVLTLLFGPRRREGVPQAMWASQRTRITHPGTSTMACRNERRAAFRTCGLTRRRRREVPCPHALMFRATFLPVIARPPPRDGAGPGMGGTRSPLCSRSWGESSQPAIEGMRGAHVIHFRVPGAEDAWVIRLDVQGE